MARAALSASRALAIINFLASRPGESFTLSEIGRALEINSSSAHTILAVLDAERYVVRDPIRKTYGLGPTPIAIGTAALDGQPALRLARERAVRLAAEHNCVCLIAVLVGHEFLIADVAGPPDRLHLHPRAGQRVPFVPPIGILRAGYGSEAEREAWLERMGPMAGPEERELYRRSALAAREQGCEIGLITPAREQIRLLMGELSQDPLNPQLHARMFDLVAQLGREPHQLLEPEHGRSYAVDTIVAAIFDSQGQITAGLTLTGLPPSLDAHRIDAHARGLATICAEITAATGGRQPLSA